VTQPALPEPAVPGHALPAPIVTVRGQAQLAGSPDLATLSVTLHAGGDTAAAVRKKLANGSAEIARLVDTFANSLEDSSTSGLHIGPVFTRKTPRRINGYAGSFSAELVLNDFDALSPVVLAATKLAGSRVSGPWWSLRPDSSLHRQVRIAAIDDARTRAADYAAAFDATLAGLIEVSDLESGLGGGAGRVMQSFAAGGMPEDDDEPEIDFEPELQTVYGQITVRFALRISR
jgi:uncharacterized protein YggE